MQPSSDAVVRFRCNICGAGNTRERSDFGREKPSCSGCGSTVRTRAMIRMLAREIFGFDLALPDFPVLKEVRGIGTSDSANYAGLLGTRFDYRNTHYDREPRVDLLHPGTADIGSYDFILCGEVLEHVQAPVGEAFANLFRMLRPNGILLLTVPYRPEGETIEHFGSTDRFGLAQVGGRLVLVRTRPDGGYEVHDNLVFHGGGGSTLEMRVFSESGLRKCIEGAGFPSLEFYSDDAPVFGILHDETWSLPITARKQPFSLTMDAVRSWAEQWNERETRIARLETELEERTEWANGLERQASERTAWAARLECELKNQLETERQWAKTKVDELHAELLRRTDWAHDLDRQLAERTNWALNLERELAERKSRMEQFDSQLWTRIGRKGRLLR